MMDWIGISGIILNTLCAAGTGAALVVGFVFYWAGFGDKRQQPYSSRQPRGNKAGFMITGTMSVVFIFFLLCSWNANLLVKQVFPGMSGGFIASLISTDQLPIASVAQTVWTLVSLYWLLPYVFDFKGIGWKWKTIGLGACGSTAAYGLLFIK